MLSHARGIPSSRNALLFLIGAVAAYALVGGLAFGDFSEHMAPEPEHAVVWGGLHFFSVGLAIGAATLVAHFVHSDGAWPLGGFLATALDLPRVGISARGRPRLAHGFAPDARRTLSCATMIGGIPVAGASATNTGRRRRFSEQTTRCASVRD